ncbi:MAG: hypothetical protein N2314_02670 [Brevinematales bacterium]|nr:hypothetical protein [Brevinematales bacterium]
MEKFVISKQAVEDLITWTLKEFPSVSLPEKKRAVSLFFVGFHQIDVQLDILVKSGVNMVETMEKLHQKLKVTLEKLAGLDLRHCKITVRGLYDESLEKQNP